MAFETTQAVVERWMDALNAHDLDSYLALLAEDYEQTSPSEQLRGKAAAEADFRDSVASQPDMELTLLALVASGEVAAVEYHMTGTLAGDIHFADGRVVGATGRRYDMDGCSFVWVRRGRISAVHHYWDRALMREQLGL